MSEQLLLNISYGGRVRVSVCAYCGKTFYHIRSKRFRRYCSAVCRQKAFRLRRGL